MNKKTFHLINDKVCTRLKLYGEDIKKSLLMNGWIPDSRDKACFMFINTCAFLKRVEDETIQRIKSLDKTKIKGQKPKITPDKNPANLLFVMWETNK